MLSFRRRHRVLSFRQRHRGTLTTENIGALAAKDVLPHTMEMSRGPDQTGSETASGEDERTEDPAKTKCVNKVAEMAVSSTGQGNDSSHQHGNRSHDGVLVRLGRRCLRSCRSTCPVRANIGRDPRAPFRLWVSGNGPGCGTLGPSHGDMMCPATAGEREVRAGPADRGSNTGTDARRADSGQAATQASAIASAEALAVPRIAGGRGGGGGGGRLRLLLAGGEEAQGQEALRGSGSTAAGSLLVAANQGTLAAAVKHWGPPAAEDTDNSREIIIARDIPAFPEHQRRHQCQRNHQQPEESEDKNPDRHNT